MEEIAALRVYQERTPVTHGHSMVPVAKGILVPLARDLESELGRDPAIPSGVSNISEAGGAGTENIIEKSHEVAIGHSSVANKAQKIAIVKAAFPHPGIHLAGARLRDIEPQSVRCN